MSETPDTDDVEEPEDEQLTETAKTRWEWLSTLAAAALIGSFLVLVGGLAFEPVPATWPDGPAGWVYLAAVIAGVTYAIGEDVTEIYQSLRGGSSS